MNRSKSDFGSRWSTVTSITSTGPSDRMWTSPLADGRHAAPPLETTRSKSAVFDAASTVPAPSSEPASSVPLIPSASARRVNQRIRELLRESQLARSVARRRAWPHHTQEARAGQRERRLTQSPTPGKRLITRYRLFGRAFCLDGDTLQVLVPTDAECACELISLRTSPSVGATAAYPTLNRRCHHRLHTGTPRGPATRLRTRVRAPGCRSFAFAAWPASLCPLAPDPCRPASGRAQPE